MNTRRGAARAGFEAATAVLDEPAAAHRWRRDFDRSLPFLTQADIEPPDGDALVALCDHLHFPEQATALIAAHRRDFDEPRVRRLGAHVQWLIATRYTADGYARLGWPPAPACAPLLYAHAALGLAQRTAAEQAAGGIEPTVTRATLWDIGRQTLLFARMHGRAGMDKGWWLSHHLSHHLFRLGRLQFQRSHAAPDTGLIAAGTAVLDVHIPGDGPLDAEACDASFARAAAFLPRHFPDDRARFLTCTSWLLDPQLVDLLGADSNIARFQRRFELVRVHEASSRVFEFVFDRPDIDVPTMAQLAGLPRDSRLRDALVAHHAAGGCIRLGTGIMPIAAD